MGLGLFYLLQIVRRICLFGGKSLIAIHESSLDHGALLLGLWSFVDYLMLSLLRRVKVLGFFLELSREFIQVPLVPVVLLGLGFIIYISHRQDISGIVLGVHSDDRNLELVFFSAFTASLPAWVCFIDDVWGPAPRLAGVPRSRMPRPVRVPRPGMP